MLGELDKGLVAPMEMAQMITEDRVLRGVINFQPRMAPEAPARNALALLGQKRQAFGGMQFVILESPYPRTTKKIVKLF